MHQLSNHRVELVVHAGNSVRSTALLSLGIMSISTPDTEPLCQTAFLSGSLSFISSYECMHA